MIKLIEEEKIETINVHARENMQGELANCGTCDQTGGARCDKCDDYFVRNLNGTKVRYVYEKDRPHKKWNDKNEKNRRNESNL